MERVFPRFFVCLLSIVNVFNKPTGRKTGKGKDMDQNMENNQTQQQGQEGSQQANNQTQQQEKLFTQDDVNRIVGERLARARLGADTSGFTEREQSLNQRELKLDAREKLADAGLPKELLNAINCNSKKEMEDSISALAAFYKTSPAAQQTTPQRTYRVSTGISSGAGNGVGSFDGSELHKGQDADIRKAMGLKG